MGFTVTVFHEVQRSSVKICFITPKFIFASIFYLLSISSFVFVVFWSLESQHTKNWITILKNIPVC